MIVTMFLIATPSIAVEWTARILGIRDGAGLNFYPEIGFLTQVFHGFA